VTFIVRVIKVIRKTKVRVLGFMKLRDVLPWIASATITLLLIIYIVLRFFLGALLVTKPTEIPPPLIDNATYTVSIVDGVVYLPLPRKLTNVSVDEVLLWRRSIREYAEEPITVIQLSMVLWATYGVNEVRWGFRTTPSAGATYPLEVYVVVGERGVAINSTHFLAAGVYKYDSFTHSLRVVKLGDVRKELQEAALGQEWVGKAPVNIVIAAVFERTTRIYGERGRVRYVPIDVGHLGQNIYLMATALGLGTVAVGAFIDEKVAEIVVEDRGEVPVYIMPIGKPTEVLKVGFEDIEDYVMRHRRGVA
jgi:SagB-type dehydrogenase family enzyme